jgi:hypothetical protein
MQSYRIVKAPFAGVVTLRNVDVRALVTAGNTMLYRIAQTGTLRTYVNAPQTNASSIHPGQPARISVTNLPGRSFAGMIARVPALRREKSEAIEDQARRTAARQERLAQAAPRAAAMIGTHTPTTPSAPAAPASRSSGSTGSRQAMRR